MSYGGLASRDEDDTVKANTNAKHRSGKERAGDEPHAMASSETDQYMQHTDLWEQIDRKATQNSEYARTAQRLTRIRPLWPTIEQWKQSSAAEGCPLLAQDSVDHSVDIALVRHVLDMAQVGTEMPEEVARQMISGGFLPEKDFRAGALHRKLRIWEEYCDQAGITDEKQRVLSTIKAGMRLVWSSPEDMHQRKESKVAETRKGVERQLLRMGLPQAEADRILALPTVCPMVFPNLLDDPQDYAFAKEQIEKNLRCGVLIPWPFEDSRPAVVMAMAVVKNSHGKARLILDGRPVNRYLQHIPFKYATASDAMRLMAPDGWLFTLDVKAGYHHILLHPVDWTYVGIYFEGKFYVHRGMAFGLSQAPECFTQVMNAVLQPLVMKGAQLTGMVDDILGAEKERVRALKSLAVLIAIMALLGFTLNGVKSMRGPDQLASYLGYMFDTRKALVFISPEKMLRIKTSLDKARSTDSDQAYKRAAGQIAAASLAFSFSSLMIRALAAEREAAKTPKAERVLQDELIKFLLDDMEELNGQPWNGRVRPAVKLVVDSSRSDTGAHAPRAAWEAVLPFSEAERRGMQTGSLSSTEAEALGILRALEEAIRTGLVPCNGMGAVQFVCDNKGTISAMNYMRGGKKVFPVVAQTHILARKSDITLTFAWEPRTNVDVTIADAYSKFHDVTDWRLARSILRKQVAAHGDSGVRVLFPPDVDMMASSEAHQVENYVAQMWDGRCAAQNAWVQDWGEDYLGGRWAKEHGRQPIVFLFPMAHQLPDVLYKIRQDRALAWVICSRYLRGIEEQSVAKLPVRARFNIQCRDVSRLVTPTRFNPAAANGDTWKTPLQALLIVWP